VTQLERLDPLLEPSFEISAARGHRDQETLGLMVELDGLRVAALVEVGLAFGRATLPPPCLVCDENRAVFIEDGEADVETVEGSSRELILSSRV
jgi:hypothetical protein